MMETTKNLLSIILPITSIFLIALAFKAQPTGLAVYENTTLYKINGRISVSIEDEIPVDSYIRISVDNSTMKINIIDFLERTGKDYKVVKSKEEEYIAGNGVYSADFASLSILQNSKKGKHVIKTELIYKDLVLYSDEKIVEAQ